MLHASLLIIALALTCAMFATRESMLGFACAIFWVLAGAQALELSTATWDIYYLMFFACAFGMTAFTMLGAYGLREKRDTIAEDEMDKEGRGEGEYQDEKGDPLGEQLDKPYIADEKPEANLSKRTKDIRERARKRREER